jgi:RHS repeat-associated protein
VRAVVQEGGTVCGEYDYLAFGEPLDVEPSLITGGDRLSFIDKEKDAESGYGDFGVRKYDDGLGRFTSIDPLWEKYYAWTPYHYCGNEPVSKSDPSGLYDGMSWNVTSEQYAKIPLSQAEKDLPVTRCIMDLGQIGIGGIEIFLTFVTKGTASKIIGPTTGALDVVAGSVKLVCDLAGKPEEADKVPNSFGELFGLVYDKITGDKNKTGQKAGNLIEKSIIFGIDLFSSPKNAIALINDAVAVGRAINDVTTSQSTATTTSSSSSKSQTFTGSVDASNIKSEDIQGTPIGN